MNCTFLKRLILAQRSFLMLTLLVLPLFAGCSSFRSDWKQRAALAPEAGSLEGRWEGTWLSGVNGHTGKLRCIVTKIAGEKYQFNYWATYWKIFSASYTVYFDARKTADSFQLTGSMVNECWFGDPLYEYQGAASGTNFTATYKSKGDHGTFNMTRP